MWGFQSNYFQFECFQNNDSEVSLKVLSLRRDTAEFEKVPVDYFSRGWCIFILHGYESS